MSRSVPRWAPPEPPARLLVDDVVTCPLWVAQSAHDRRTGLLGTDALDGALWLEPCASVHTLGMRYPIDVVFVDRAGRVRTVVTMPPGRLGLPRRARAVVELPAGDAARLGIAPGTRIGPGADPQSLVTGE